MGGTSGRSSRLPKKKQKKTKVRSSQKYFEVERILDHHESGDGHWYLVKWKGYSSRSNSWEPEANLSPSALQEAEALRFRIRQYRFFGANPHVRILTGTHRGQTGSVVRLAPQRVQVRLASGEEVIRADKNLAPATEAEDEARLEGEDQSEAQSDADEDDTAYPQWREELDMAGVNSEGEPLTETDQYESDESSTTSLG